MSNRRTLVVGTTPDYIDLIRQCFPGRSLFLTDVQDRAGAVEPRPPAPSELLSNLACYDETFTKLREHIDHYGIVLRGIACFDCESMLLAANIAQSMSIPYATPEAIGVCRNKYTCKQMWHEIGLPCPKAGLVGNASEAQAFLHQTGTSAVLKPVAGSGSEYVFPCANDQECVAAFSTIESHLSELRNNANRPLYSRDLSEANTRYPCVMEEFVRGDEYSCDFVIDGDDLQIVRIARKMPASGMSFGTTLAYVVPSDLPHPLTTREFSSQLRSAARALGLERAICMLDFIVRDGKAIMIEMTPRPGGDCLPPLLRRSAGFDMLGFALDFAEGRISSIPHRSEWALLVGLRLFAKAPGTVAEIATEAIQKDERIVEYHIKHGVGHEIAFPPEDYDSRLLGHVIFKPSSADAFNVAEECTAIAALLDVEIRTAP